MTLAALFVATGGCYFGIEDVDPWDEPRDARLYAGPWPVVAHPPCARWCRLAGLVEKVYGYKRGDDGGCFAAALAAVRKWGGVLEHLEHPAYSDAFAAHGIPAPTGPWQRTTDGGWVCYVEQWYYGHPAKKATWLYAFGLTPPQMRWGRTPDNEVTAYVTDGGGDIKRRHRAMVSWCGNHMKRCGDRPRLRARQASATPAAFRDLLLSMARSVEQRSVDAERAR
jgi:hypothetical protein